MAAPADYLDADDLKDVTAGGVIHEDVLDRIWDNSDIPMPLLDMIAESSHKAAYTSWTEDKLASPDLTNKHVSGSDSSSSQNKATVANRKRIGNHNQICKKDVQVTERADAVDEIGTGEA